MKAFKIVSITLLVVSLGFIVLGFATGMKLSDISDFLSEDYKYTKADQFKSYEVINSIAISVDVKEVNIKTHEEDFITVDYYTKEKETWLVEVNEGSLFITQTSRLQLFSFGFNISEHETIKIYLPASGIYMIDIETKTGTVNIDNLKMSSLNIDVTTGEVVVKNSIVTNEVDIKTTTGEVTINEVNAGDLNVSVTTGEILINAVVSDNIYLKATTGSIIVTGAYNDYSLKLTTNTGDIKVNNNNQAKSYTLAKDSNKKIEAKSNTGSIRVTTN